jgi:hypothetical protein
MQVQSSALTDAKARLDEAAVHKHERQRLQVTEVRRHHWLQGTFF